MEWEEILKKDESEKRRELKQNGQPISVQSFYKKTQCSDFADTQQIEGDILYQIHGSLNNLDSASLTTSQYVENYRDNNGLKGFLERVFAECSVLFIGSGMQEFEILEHCLKHSPHEHYALIGIQTEEENLFRVKKAYFQDIKIKAVPYYLDFQGHERLLFLLKFWVQEIKYTKDIQFYNITSKIDEVL